MNTTPIEEHKLMSISLTAETTIQRNPELISADLEGETVMMSIENGSYFGMNTVASYIWEQIEEPANISTILQAICTKYNVDEKTAMEDLETFVQELINDQIVSIH